jgi:5-methylcytosine-specific restriction endonuclease McrA
VVARKTPEERRATYRAWYIRNRAKKIAVARALYLANRPHYLAAAKANRAANRERQLAYLAEYRLKNAERCREIVRRWNATPGGKAIARWHNLKRRSLVTDVSPAIVEARFELFDRRCAYCGSDGDGRSLHADHLLAVKNGGRNFPENIVPACARCNLSKGSKQWRAWYRSRSFYDPARETFIDGVS